jgi:glycosyltransferase involved in cell wall biosynthesis
MRIVIDMQAAQTESRLRGIDGHTMLVTQAIVRNRGEHEILLALSGMFPDTIEHIRATFDGLLPQENIRIWHAPGPVMEKNPVNDGRREAAELIREAFLASLKPDVIHISSLFEGYVDDTVTSIGRFDHRTPVSVSLFEPAPLRNPDHDLKSDPCYTQYYLRKVEQLRQATLYLVTSEFTRQDGLAYLNLQECSVVNISAAIEPNHQALQIDDEYPWDESARRAIAAFESLHAKRPPVVPLLPQRRPRLAYVSPLPPERTGIADYSAELLPELSRLYEIDVIVLDNAETDPSITSYCAIRTVAWFIHNAERYDRVLYHFGNSVSHQHMFDLLKAVPGVVVLHDFFLGDVVAHMEFSGVNPGRWERELYHSHGYKAVQSRFETTDIAEVTAKYPCNLSVLQEALGVIVHSRYSMHLAEQWYCGEIATEWVDIPHLRIPNTEVDKKNARAILGVADDALVVCAFGLLGPSKLNHRLLDAWLSSALAEQDNCYLFFVGQNHQGGYGLQLERRIAKAKAAGHVRITGWVDTETFRTYLAAADIGVQLRALSRGETSGTVLDCMNYGLATIANANGSMAELDPEAVYLLPDNFEDAALVTALETLWKAPEHRRSLAERARLVIFQHHAPAECARRYAKAIEIFHQHAATSTTALILALAAQEAFAPSEIELSRLSSNLADTLPSVKSAKRLFLDVSATCQNDLKTGIERVVRALTLALLEAPPTGCRIEPVYLDEFAGKWHYRRACHYTLGLLACPTEVLEDEIVEPEYGDILLGLDVAGNALVQAADGGLIRDWRNKGVQMYFLVHDLLPIRMPEVFPPGADESHAIWLQAVSKFDGAICVSKAVADDLAKWQMQADIEFADRRPFNIGWSHHGADVSNSLPSTGLPNNAKSVLRHIKVRPSFLMVGTIEPRKAYLQTIEAFSQLWREGIEVNLVIVGKEGWKNLPDNMRRDIPRTIERLKTHPELNRRLFWLEGISDEYLEMVYGASACLIAASYGEGFGLPLIEAAQHKLPIIARDIPVFREVAGAYAQYFAAAEPNALIEAIDIWLARTPGEFIERTMPYLSWEESASNLSKLILQGAHENKNNNSPHSGMRRGKRRSPRKNLYVDVSVVSRDDFKTGIQRVVRSVLLELLSNPPEGYRVVPVYLAEKNGQWNYYPANKALREYRKTARIGITPDDSYKFTPARGDIILGLDLAGGYVVAASSQGLYKNLIQLGVSVYFVLYDLLPITQADYFSSNDTQGHTRWVESISRCSGVICISKSVENEYIEWHKSNIGKLPENLSIGHFHLGADIERSFPTSGFPDDFEKTFAAINEGVAFVIVGTIEPRKGHLQVIKAFERLWLRKHDVKLVIIGKDGWMAEQIVGHIRAHPELNHRLFWLEGISDEYLEKVYATSSCLIAASYGEGFGLPLIEAAQHKLPIIARDIPVFHEVAGEHAFYFSATSPDELAGAMEEWLGLYGKDKHPKSDSISWLTWAQCSTSLLAQIGLSRLDQ